MGHYKPANYKGDLMKRKVWKKWNTYFDETTIKAPMRTIYFKYQKKIKEFKENQKEAKI